MKKLFLAFLLVSFTLPSFAATMNVSCGEIKKVKEKTKNIFPFPFSLLGTRTIALKVKLLNATDYMISYSGTPALVTENRRTIKLKLAYTDTENYTKHLNLLKEAVYEKNNGDETVYACFGKVVGFERWHNVASTSTRSENEALEELIRKYL